MFENETYPVILERMLGRAPGTVTKREGSFLWDALAPVAAELTQAYIFADGIMTETYAMTASRAYLVLRARERGMAPYPATYAVGKAQFNIPVEQASRFSLELFNYSVLDVLDGENHIYSIVCETQGTAPNATTGKLIPIAYIDGLQTAELLEITIPGEDEEDTEAFRKRYLDSFRSQAFGGNRADYIQKVTALPGVGGVKVYRGWQGGGTVKLVILDSDYKEPSGELIDRVQTEIDPVVNGGEGVGIAPIDHRVTVFGASSRIIDIVTTITYAEGWTFADVKGYIETVIDTYYKEANALWSENVNLIIRISQIETRILDIEGIVDIADTKLNGIGRNLVLGADEIAKRGEFHDGSESS